MTRQRFRSALVAVEVALSVVLAIGAGSLTKSLAALQEVDTGFDADGVLTFELSLDRAAYPEPHDIASFYSRLEERLQASPAVVAAGGVRALPFRAMPSMETMTLRGAPRTERDDGEDGVWRNAHYQVVGTEYFDALSIPVIWGRGFDARDGDGAPPVAIVNESMARLFWNGDALGRPVRMGAGPESPNPEMTIVGVVRDVRQRAPHEPPSPQLFVPRAQAGLHHGGFAMRRSFIAVRATDLTPPDASRLAIGVVRSLDPQLPVANVETLADVVAGSIADRRLLTGLLSGLTLMALALAAVGIYGLVAFTVATRTREIGLRVALGANEAAVMGYVMARSIALAAIGVLAGMVAGAGANRTLSAYLFATGTLDGFVFAAAPTLMFAIAAAATYVPARRAASISPQEALRQD